MKDPLLPVMLLQKKVNEESCATVLQKAELSLQSKTKNRLQAEQSLQLLLSQQPASNLGRQRLQDLQRVEAFLQKKKEAETILRQLEVEELSATQALSAARIAFTEAAHERKSIELALASEHKKIETKRDQKQEEEREESWRTQRLQTHGDK